MFGYVVIDKPELKFKEFDEYRSFYCGLCRTLKQQYGICGQITLNYDLTFLAILLSGLYDCETAAGSTRCIAHPFVKQPTLDNRFIEYAADMNILLTYYQCVDDWNDDRKVSKKLLSSALKNAGKKVSLKYPGKIEVIVRELDKLSEYENNKETDIDKVSGCFGRLLSCVFAYRHDEWSDYLSKLGFFLGKYIYILDAYLDLEDDKKKGKYNPFYQSETDEDHIKSILTMMMAEASSAYDMLPIVEHKEILDNIIYAGVWTAFACGRPAKKHEFDKD